MFHLKQLQQMRLTNHEVNEAIKQIQAGEVPPQLKDFAVRGDKFIDLPLNLKYVRPADRKSVMTSL